MTFRDGVMFFYGSYVAVGISLFEDFPLTVKVLFLASVVLVMFVLDYFYGTPSFKRQKYQWRIFQ